MMTPDPWKAAFGAGSYAQKGWLASSILTWERLSSLSSEPNRSTRRAHIVMRGRLPNLSPNPKGSKDARTVRMLRGETLAKDSALGIP